MKKSSLKYLIVFTLILTACSKGSDTPSGGNNNGGGNNGGGNNGGDNNGGDNTTCVISAISQVNSGAVSESSLSAFYNSNYDVTKLIVYDSVHNTKNFETDFSYITADSVRINQYQYFIRDANKRIIHFSTKSDLADLKNADDYLFEYSYNDKGYLVSKYLYINGSPTPNFKTVYTYTNNLLTGCVMTAVSSGNPKVLESTLTYDNTFAIKNWIYTFPDAIEGWMYLTVLNFGNRPSSPLKQVVTKIYDPSSGTLLDTWTTNYSNYNVNENGYIVSGEAKGDLQQGIAAFYGKTNFYYECY